MAKPPLERFEDRQRLPLLAKEDLCMPSLRNRGRSEIDFEESERIASVQAWRSEQVHTCERRREGHAAEHAWILEECLAVEICLTWKMSQSQS